MQEALDRYKNLELITRDRGNQYRALRGNFYHIADRFHLLMNITKMMMSEMTRTIPSRVIFGENNGYIKKLQTSNSKRSLAQATKEQLIRNVQKDYKLTQNISKTAKRFSLNFRTAKNYITCNGSLDQAVSRRCSYLDPYQANILAMHTAGSSATEIYNKLRKKGVDCKLRTVSYFIEKNIQSTGLDSEHSDEKRLVVSRKEIFNYVFTYKTEPVVEQEISCLLNRYPLIGLLKRFYTALRRIFLTQDDASLKKILKRKMKTAVLNRIIKSLNTDYHAVINAARYKLSNGVVEGSVSKIKRIKHAMYGRGSVDLLRNKAIYQSYFFRPN